jgi:long-chain acyl-CoA synthetase
MSRTLLDLLDSSVARYGHRPALALRHDDGTTTSWSYRELDRRARIAAWRLRALDLEPGDRILTWSPSTPELPAAYYGAMHARLVLVPLDLRMSPDAIETIVRASGARHLILGTGRDAPDPREAGLADFPTTTVDALTADPAEDDRPSRRTGKHARPRGGARPPMRSWSWCSPAGPRASRRA